MDIVKGNIEAENMSIHESEEITDYDGYEDVLYMYDTPETGLFDARLNSGHRESRMRQ